ncbi:MAG: hypothetical protein PVI21_01875 [Candidatus Woesebacteria bacterium]|jgi:hypothetical protein
MSAVPAPKTLLEVQALKTAEQIRYSVTYSTEHNIYEIDVVGYGGICEMPLSDESLAALQQRLGNAWEVEMRYLPGPDFLDYNDIYCVEVKPVTPQCTRDDAAILAAVHATYGPEWPYHLVGIEM